jgi:CBS domain-containing protein
MHIAGNIDCLLNQKGRSVWSIDPDATVFDAIRLMSEKNIGALLVMRGEHLVGVFSERDYARNVVLKGKTSKQTPVREVITGNIISVESGQTVEECMRLMTEHRVRHLPVLDESRVVGIISIGDLVNWIISAQSVALTQMQDYISGKYPG